MFLTLDRPFEIYFLVLAIIELADIAIDLFIAFAAYLHIIAMEL